MIAWHRDIHKNPELSNHEVRTAAMVAAYLKTLGIDVKTGVAHTGVVGVLRGGKPGRVVALRADMDALPVVEETGLPYRIDGDQPEYLGQACRGDARCGHDNHAAILMGVAKVVGRARAIAGHRQDHLPTGRRRCAAGRRGRRGCVGATKAC